MEFKKGETCHETALSRERGVIRYMGHGMVKNIGAVGENTNFASSLKEVEKKLISKV